MELSRLIDIDNNPSVYGLNSKTKEVLDSEYPTFNAIISPSEFLYIAGTQVSVSINLSNFRVKGKFIKPDSVKINGTPIDEYQFSETIQTSKQYDIEVLYNGKATVKSKVVLIIEPVRVMLHEYTSASQASNFEADWIEGGLPILVYKSGVYEKEIVSEIDGYLWVFIPSNVNNLMGISSRGLLKIIEFEEQTLLISKEYRAFRSINKLNKGLWNLLLHLDCDTKIQQQNFKVLSGDLFKTKDGNLLKVVDNG